MIGFEQLGHFFEYLDQVLWTYIGFSTVVIAGLWLTIKTKFAQIRLFPQAINYAWQQSKDSSHTVEGLHPLKAFWATLGGAVGIGNVVGICSAVQLGGPGAVLWVWFVAFVGVLLKYTEVYLGMKYRKKRVGGWDGGPMYYLPEAFKSTWLPVFTAILLLIYGIEVYQFHVMVDSITLNWHLPKLPVVLFLLTIVIYTVRGGMHTLSQILSKVVPIMIAVYLFMTGFVIFQHLKELPAVFATIFKSAFTGHAAIGGFVGSGFMQTFSQGIARGCYASDIGIGYTSILHAESSETQPERQASLTFVGIFADILGMCTLSMLLILVTGVWHQPVDQTMQVQQALALYFPGMNLMMPILIFFLGYSTVTAFFVFGLKCSQFLSPCYGPQLYYLYGIGALFTFSYCTTRHALLLMSFCQLILLLINVIAFIRLYKKVQY
jgi:AGCS family alanine or glycine:cation symporter